MLKLPASASWFMRIFPKSQLWLLQEAPRRAPESLSGWPSHPVDGSVEFVEGAAAVHGAARDSDIAAVPAIVQSEVSYGVLGDLSVPEDIGAVEQLLRHSGSGSECFHLAGQTFPAKLVRLAVTRGHLAEEQGIAFAVALSGDCFSKPTRDPITG